jgi:hypothetical protein
MDPGAIFEMAISISSRGVITVMKILVDIPMNDYTNFLQRCDASRPEYEMLKNGIITQDREKRPAVEILCDVEDAKMILNLASEVYPYAVAHVRECISLARKPQSSAAQ